MQAEPKQTKSTLANLLWGKKGSVWLVLIAAAIVLFAMLDAKELWTQEWRWANIAHQMLLRHDFFHPYLAGQDYYDKPLLSYWFIVGFSFLFKQLNLWAIRLPSAMAGFITVWCTYLLGKKLSSKQTGLIAAWLLITSGYFIFWARVGNADMLNIAGIMLAVTWYFIRRDKPGFLSYTVFFLILAIACLCKGLIAAAVTIVIIIPDLLYQKNWKQHLNIKLFLSLIPGLLVYFAPFIASTYLNPQHYGESGLLEVFRENILRYFRPFDHEQPYYTYFIYLPLAIFPWILFMVPALITFPARWRSALPGSRWFFWAIILVFAFFTLSGSRRNYYVLPMIPFAILFTADWIHHLAEKESKLNTLAGYFTGFFYLLILLAFVVLIPVSYLGGGTAKFAQLVHQRAEQLLPWQDWKINVIATRNNVTYYLKSPQLIKVKRASATTKAQPTQQNILANFPILQQKDPNTIIILGKNYFKKIKDVMKDYTIIQTPPTLGNRFLHNEAKDVPVALIPNQPQQQKDKIKPGRDDLVDVLL